MGFTLSAYSILLISGGGLRYTRLRSHQPQWLRLTHIGVGSGLVLLVVGLLSIGLVGTIGEHGSLGHSIHLPAGLVVVALVGVSAWSASRISPERPWARSLHLGTNGLLFLALAAVSWTGWTVVQQYL